MSWITFRHCYWKNDGTGRLPDETAVTNDPKTETAAKFPTYGVKKWAKGCDGVEFKTDHDPLIYKRKSSFKSEKKL